MKASNLMIFTLLVAGAVQAAYVQGEYAAIGYAGNATNTSGYGAVGYAYSIAKTEVTVGELSRFYKSGKVVGTTNSLYNNWSAVKYTGSSNAPAGQVSFNQAAQYANWLTTGSATNGAYTIDGAGAVTAIKSRAEVVASGQTYYLVANEDEWYKAAYFKADGSGYSLYANGQGIAPSTNDWRYNSNDFYNTVLSSVRTGVWATAQGSVEQNGTYDMMGNMAEILEGGLVYRGGQYNSAVTYLADNKRTTGINPSTENSSLGVRLVMIPEPVTVGMLGLGALLTLGGL